MSHKISAAILLVVVSLATPLAFPQARSTTPQPAQPQPAPPQTQAPRPQRGQRATTPAKPPTPMTLRQVLEALSTTKSSKRVEDMVSKAGVQFQATAANIDILNQFGASPALIAMIPPPPAPAPGPMPAGPLTVTCEPKDCRVVVNDASKGTTTQHRITVNGLTAGDATVEVFADGYDPVSRRVRLESGKPAEEKFALKRNPQALQQEASALLVKVIASLGGTDGFGQLADIEGSGFMQWKNNEGKMEEWGLTFNKRVGKDLVATFKTKDGQCTATVVADAAKQDCKAGLRNGGDKVAAQGTSLFLSYQPQDVIQALFKRPLTVSETDENRLESANPKDSYTLTLTPEGLPARLIYRIADGTAPIQVDYGEYFKTADTRYPAKITIGRLNETPSWIFMINNVRTKLTTRGSTR